MKIWGNIWGRAKKKKRNQLIYNRLRTYVVVLPGLEPGQTGPESVVLPLHHKTLWFCDHKSKKNVNIKKIFIELI